MDESFFRGLKKRLDRSLEVLIVLHYVSVLNGIFSFFSVGLVVYLLTTRFYIVALIYLPWIWIFDRQTPFKGGRRIAMLRHLFIWKYFANYFPIKLHKTADLDSTKNYMFCFHPHGLHSFSLFVNFCTEATGFSHLFPGIICYPLTLDVVFKVPLHRDYALAYGVSAVSKESINYKLTKLGGGHSVVIVPGGAHETEKTSVDEPYRLKLKDRVGFVREGLRAGASLVPVFSFGESEILSIVRPSPDSLLGRAYSCLRNTIGGGPIIGRGAAILLPIRKEINTIIGSPLQLPQLPNPTDNEIAYWHGKYVESLARLFNDHKERFGTPGKELDLF